MEFNVIEIYNYTYTYNRLNDLFINNNIINDLINNFIFK